MTILPNPGCPNDSRTQLLGGVLIVVPKQGTIQLLRRYHRNVRNPTNGSEAHPQANFQSLENERRRAHIGQMPLGTKTTVIFACPKCGLVYCAMQERRSPSRFGSFKCRKCNAEIYRWSSYYDYVDWKQVELNERSGDWRFIGPS